MSSDDKIIINHRPTELEEIKKLLQENLDYAKANYLLMKKVHKFILWQKFFSVLKILVILIPIILGVIYLPPLLQEVIDAYRNLLK